MFLILFSSVKNFFEKSRYRENRESFFCQKLFWKSRYRKNRGELFCQKLFWKSRYRENRESFFCQKLFWKIAISRESRELFCQKLFWKIAISRESRELFLSKSFLKIAISRESRELFLSKLFEKSRYRENRESFFCQKLFWTIAISISFIARHFNATKSFSFSHTNFLQKNVSRDSTRYTPFLLDYLLFFKLEQEDDKKFLWSICREAKKGFSTSILQLPSTNEGVVKLYQKYSILPSQYSGLNLVLNKKIPEMVTNLTMI